MSVSTEVKRTLVKSRPELWAELSDPESLERHLGVLGEIRIIRAEPDTIVNWQAEGTSGSVQLEPSGFGTRVTLSLTRELREPDTTTPQSEPAAEPQPVESQPAGESQPIGESQPAGESQSIGELSPNTDPEPEPIDDIERTQQSAMEAPPAIEPEPQPAATRLHPRHGFFARLFRRKAPIDPEPAAALKTADEVEPESLVLRVEPMVVLEPAVTEGEPAPAAAVEPDPEPVAIVEPTPTPETEPGRLSTDPGEDLATLEAEMADRDAELLTAMLDRLGAAHHRPFSRG